MIRNNDQEQLQQLEKRNLRYLNLFRLFISLFFFLLINTQQLQDIFQPERHHLYLTLVINVYLAGSILIMVMTYMSKQDHAISASKLILFIDLLVMIYLAYGTNGFSQGLATLPILAIGSAAVLFRQPLNILLAPLTASALLWLLPVWVDFGLGVEVTDSSKLLHVLGYFVIALIGIRQSISYTSTLAMYKNQRQTISGLEDMNQIIIERLTNGVIIYQQDYVILHANQSAKKLLDMDDIIFFPEDIMDFLRSQKDGMVYHTDHGLDLYLRKASVSEEKSFGVLFIEDSSYLKKAAQQLNLASLGKMSSSIAHEIRNPLAAIKTAAELLVESPDLQGQDKDISEIIVNQTTRANHIIEDILQMSRRKTANPEDLVLFDCLAEAKQQLVDELKVEARQIQIIVPKDTRINFDPDHFKQIAWNLASNAIKHGQTQELQMVAHGHTLDFKNQGEAFDEKKIRNLFEPFFTDHNRGTGLGLHICRQLCHDNHADLSYHYINGQHVFRIEFNLG
jgi:two-component system sensor histidine kinase PilS (NtrC family)